jgi:ABC-type sulfate transport system permease component
VYIGILGVGLGLVIQVIVLVVQNAVDFRDLGTATSDSTFFRSMGGSFGVSVLGTVFNNTFGQDLARALPSGVSAARLTSGSGTTSPAQLAQLPQPIHTAYIHAYAQSLDTVFLFALPFAVAAFVLTWFLQELPLRKQVESAGTAEANHQALAKNRAAHV